MCSSCARAATSPRVPASRSSPTAGANLAAVGATSRSTGARVMAKADATKPAAPKPAQQGGKAPQAKGQPRKEKAPETQPAIAKGRPKGTGQVPALMKERGYANVWAVPRLNKIVINMGVGEGRDNAKIMDFATADLQAITGQKH